MARPQLTRELVVETAAEIADREGFDAVTLTRVANELGTSQPALYRHVAGYDQLVRALALAGREILGRRLADAAVGLSGDAAVAAMAGAWRTMVGDHPGLYEATDRYPYAGDQELEQAVDRVVDTLAQGLLGFELDDTARLHGARALRCAFHGFSHLEATGRASDLDESFEQLIAILCSGLRSTG